jgi:hypothetical protein
MGTVETREAPLRHADRFFIGGEWVEPSSNATIEVIDSFGGFKQSGLGREGGEEGLRPFLETKSVILDGRPAGYR